MVEPAPEWKQIARLLDDPRRPVIVVVGAGVAIAETGQPQASWLGLLKHGIRHLVQTRFQPGWGAELEASLERAFSPFDLQAALQHAELVEQALNTPDEQAFAQWLESAFVAFRPGRDPERSGLLSALADLQAAGALLLTTNYDGLLSDATGLPPVTWQETAAFHRVMTRQAPGILHVHGHWQRPASVILGRSSYERVVADAPFQELLKTLWLDGTWVYVGCGDGLDDPNLGRLLQWSHTWSASAPRHFFLAREDAAAAMTRRPGTPPNLACVGYTSHERLPALLRSVTPAARCWPFVLVGRDFHLFRVPGSNIPFPSHEEYLARAVPRCAADDEVEQRLLTHGWACVLDVASVGKTTLALRVATAPDQRGHPVFYLDLKDETLEDCKDETLEDCESDLARALRAISRHRTLIVIDNVHLQPSLARRLWQQWSALSPDVRGRLLLVATSIRQAAASPEQDLTFYVRHPANPAIRLRLTPEDLGRIAEHIYVRAAGAAHPPMPRPPAEALAAWHRDYGTALNAFTFAVSRSLAELRLARWALPHSRASEWVRENWLNQLTLPERDNVISLAAFGTAEVEMPLPIDALPHPGQVSKLTRLGLLTEVSRGPFDQSRRVGLREPEWGRLVLAAVDVEVEPEAVRIETAARNPSVAAVLSIRLRREGLLDEHGRLWQALQTRADALSSRWAVASLRWLHVFLQEATAAGTTTLTSHVWGAVESDPEAFGTAASASALIDVVSFLEMAKEQHRDVARLWGAVESRSETIAGRAWDTSLEELGCFLDTARRHERDPAWLWEAIEREPSRFAARAWDASLEHVAHLLLVAQAHGRDTGVLWQALMGEAGERDGKERLDRLVACARETSLDGIGAFLEVGRNQGRDMQPLWDELLGRSSAEDHDVVLRHLASSAERSSIGTIGSFFKVAKRHQQNVDRLVDLFTMNPRWLSGNAPTVSMAELAGFAHYAPPSLIDIVLAELKPGQWDAVPESKGLVGATWFARRCRHRNREDLASDLIRLLLRRANWRDVPPQRGGFAQACWLLANAPPDAPSVVDAFLTAVCTQKWLQIAYIATSLPQLASGLRQLALSHPAERVARFHHKGLGGRLAKEFVRFSRATTSDQSAMVECLGCATLCGWAVGRAWLTRVERTELGRLPVDVLPHRAEATCVEDIQLQLWLGLRAYASATHVPIPLPVETLRTTLALWEENRRQTAEGPRTTADRINQSMVSWLQGCLRARVPAVVPSPEPLWTLVGFPARIRRS